MKNYIKPEFEVHNFDVETSIMTDPTPTATAPIAAQNLLSGNNISTTTDSLSKKYYSEYQSGDSNWTWEEQN